MINSNYDIVASMYKTPSKKWNIEFHILIHLPQDKNYSFYIGSD